MPIPDPTPYVLVLARIAGLVMAAPLLGHLLVPRRARIGLAVVMAIALAPTVAGAATPATSIAELAGRAVVETVIGLTIGFVAQLVFAGVQLGGQMAGIEIGFGLANLVDPQSNAQSTVVAEWEQLLALLAFLALDAHHLLVGALVESFRIAPITHATIGREVLFAVPAQAAQVFAIGLRIAAPVLIVLLLANATLGVLQRTIPQLNVFVVGFPVNVGVGLVVLGASLPFTFRFLAERFAALGPTIGGLLRGFAGG